MNLEVGKRYEVISSLEWISKGSIVEVFRMYDHYTNLDVTLVKGWCKISGVFSISKKHLKPIKESPMKATNKFPDYNFKVSTEGFNKEELKAAYEWLKECAIDRGMSYGGSLRDDSEYSYSFHVGLPYVVKDTIEVGNHVQLPEIKLTTTTSVTSFEKVDNKVLQIEELIGKLSTQLKEAEQQLKSIRGE